MFEYFQKLYFFCSILLHWHVLQGVKKWEKTRKTVTVSRTNNVVVILKRGPIDESFYGTYSTVLFGRDAKIILDEISYGKNSASLFCSPDVGTKKFSQAFQPPFLSSFFIPYRRLVAGHSLRIKFEAIFQDLYKYEKTFVTYL